MREKLESLGKCVYCGKLFKNNAISKHLNSHLKELEKGGQKDISFHVSVTGKYSKEMFLNILVDGSAKLKEVDNFLRDIWLECCGHLSSFTNTKVREQNRGKIPNFFEEINEEEEILYPGQSSMKVKAKDVFQKGLVLEYDYDFGSTTTLKVVVLESFNYKTKEKILLLSRNEPLKLLCSICGKGIAEVMCSVCWEDNLFCKKCAKKHAEKCEDFAEYAKMPVVNSPRMGVCGYEGGVIDLERDGVYKEQ